MTNGLTEWKGTHKITLTISRETDNRAEATAFGNSLLEELEGGTLKETTGIWKGVVEHGIQIEVVADSASYCESEARKVADAALDNGCSAIQWEQQSGNEYACREYRALDSTDSL